MVFSFKAQLLGGSWATTFQHIFPVLAFSVQHFAFSSSFDRTSTIGEEGGLLQSLVVLESLAISPLLWCFAEGCDDIVDADADKVSL